MKISSADIKDDPNIGLNPWKDYILQEFVGKGKIGKVYKAISKANPNDILACKVILPEKLKAGWERELEKLSMLRGISTVVPYFNSGVASYDLNKSYVFVMYQFIDGCNLKDYIKQHGNIDLALIELLAQTIIKVLFACQKVNILHGDLHEGNIMISKPDDRIVGSPKTIWVTDFGYGGSHNHVRPKDDLKQLFSILSALLHKLSKSELNPRDRIVYDKIQELLDTKLLEHDATQKKYASIESIVYDFENIGRNAEVQVAVEKQGGLVQGPGDYLWAEALGYRANEWKILFVPEILGSRDLLSKNITILTGARGCGKTMAFRRLTAYMDALIGENSGVQGADEFVGFYVNCRDIVEAFPWLPLEGNIAIAHQIIHFFHLLWLAEICKTLAIKDITISFNWLDSFINKIFKNRYQSLPEGADVLSHVRAFVENEKEKCRLTRVGKIDGIEEWPLLRIDFLDLVQKELHQNIPWIARRPLYFFLDDYTIPTITRSTQRVLNPIIFKRRSDLFFKISTESSNSFDNLGIQGKPLELNQDYELIDMATESLHQNERSKQELLNKIFIPRIDRHIKLKNQNLNLLDILGKTTFSGNELARKMREASQNGNQKRIEYHGISAFVGMWSSDTRSMIQMFVDVLREAEIDTSGQPFFPVKAAIQDRVYRTAGGELLKFMESVTDPSSWELGKLETSTKLGGKFGNHLKDIVEAFINVSRYEMTQGNLVSNQGRQIPKQAFRIEILDKFELPEEISNSYYIGLTRWHIFFQDWRGKSVRGMLTPRLFLNRMLIPYTNLTFSSHDSLAFNNDEFIRLLADPKAFYVYWKKKRRGPINVDTGPNLFNQKS